MDHLRETSIAQYQDSNQAKLLARVPLHLKKNQLKKINWKLFLKKIKRLKH